MERVGEHPVPAGPLCVRWLAVGLPAFRAGAEETVRLELENAGLAPWRSRGSEGVQLAYHWLDDRGNPVVWDGTRHSFERTIQPGERVQREVLVRAPIPAGPYRLAFDLVEERRYWFAELGNVPLELDAPVGTRLARRALAVCGADAGALEGLDEPPVSLEEAEANAWLAPGIVPEHDWARQILDAHAEGYVAVGGAVRLEHAWRKPRLRRALAPWAVGGGRSPAFQHPLLCPSTLIELAAKPRELHGLPVFDPPGGEPWIHDGRIVVKLRPRPGRRSA